MRVTRKVLEQLCANVNVARANLRLSQNLESNIPVWYVDRDEGVPAPTGFYEVWSSFKLNGMDIRKMLRAGMTASECEAFLQGALEVARS